MLRIHGFPACLAFFPRLLLFGARNADPWMRPFVGGGHPSAIVSALDGQRPATRQERLAFCVAFDGIPFVPGIRVAPRWRLVESESAHGFTMGEWLDPTGQSWEHSKQERRPRQWRPKFLARWLLGSGTRMASDFRFGGLTARIWVRSSPSRNMAKSHPGRLDQRGEAVLLLTSPGLHILGGRFGTALRLPCFLVLFSLPQSTS